MQTAEVTGVAQGRPWVRSIVTFAVGLAVVAFLCHKLEVRTATELLKHVSLPLLALSVGALSVSHLLRGVRWGILLRGKVSFLSLFMYSAVGYLVSSVAPAQAGDFVKPALVRARHGLPYSVAAASVVVDRLLDVATIVLLGAIAFLALPVHAPGPPWIAASLKTGGLLCALGFLILALGSRWAGGVSGMVLKVLALVRLPARTTERITGMMSAFLHEAGAALSPAYLFFAMLCSVALWAAHAASVMIIFRAVNGRVPSIPLVLLGFAVLSFGLAVPLTPGCVGQFEGLWLVIFAGLHVGPEGNILAAGLLAHALILLLISIFGLLGLGFLRLSGSSGSWPGSGEKLNENVKTSWQASPLDLERRLSGGIAKAD